MKKRNSITAQAARKPRPPPAHPARRIALVEQVLREVDPTVAFRAAHASKGKLARAEPVAALYEQGRVSHVGAFPALEDEMCAPIDPGRSPDRLDALVWAITDLMLRQRAEPRIRVL